MTGVSDAIYEWARGYYPNLRLNAILENIGDKALITSAGTPQKEYIDGSAEIQVDFTLVLVAPWSEGIDGLNRDALEEGERWLDWVREQGKLHNLPAIDGIVEVEVDDEAPVLVEVTQGALWARYQFQAHIIYRRS